MSRRTRYFLYACFTAFSIFFAALVTFPYDVLGRRLETMAAQAIPGATLQVNRIGPALPFGLKLADVTFTLPPKDGKPGAPIQIDKLRITPVWTKLLTLKPAIGFTLAAFGGQVSGDAVVTKEARHFDLTIDPSKAIQLEDGAVLERITGADIQGGVSGKVSLNVDAKGVIQAGTVEAQVDGARLKGGKAMGFPLPATDFGTIELEANIEKGEAKVEKFKIKSQDVEGVINNGTIRFAPDILMSMVHGTAKLKFSDAWFARNPTIHQLIGFAGPMHKPDGSLEVPLSGTLSRPVNLPGFGR